MSQTDKDIICRCFFYAANWFIEVINTFARSKPMRAKVIHRLRDVVELKEKFYSCLAKNLSFMPPPSVFFGEPIRSRVLPAAGTKAKKGMAKKKGKAAKEKVDHDRTTQATPNKVYSFANYLNVVFENNKDSLLLQTIIHSTPLNSIASRLDFTVSQQQQTKTVQPDAIHSTYAIHFRELDLSVFILLSSSLELSGDSSSVTLQVYYLLL